MTTNRNIDEPAGPGTPKPTYRERRERRMGKREEWAEKRDEKGVSASEKARQAVEGIPPGQPILVGHHSEAGHRRALARHDAAMRQSFEHSDMAARHAQAAETIGRQLNQSIYSDDVDAAERLQQRIGQLEAERERIKAINAHIRKAGSVEGLDLSEKEKKDLFLAAQMNGTKGYPPYALQNLSGNISRQRKRLNQLLSERPSMEEPNEGPTASPDRETPLDAPGPAAVPAPASETGPRTPERASEEQAANLRRLLSEAGDYNLFHGLPGRNVVLSREVHDFMTRDEPVSAAAANEAAESLKAGITAATAEQELHRIYAGSALLRAGFDPETVEQQLAAWNKRVPDPESIDKAVAASAQPTSDFSSWQDRRLLQDLERRTSTPPAKVKDLDAEQELARRLAAETGDSPAWTGYVGRLEERRQTERQTAEIRQRPAVSARTAEPKGFPVAAELRAWDKEGISDLELYERLAARGVGVIPPERLRPDERRDYSPVDRYGRSTHKSPLSLGELFARRVGAEDRAMEQLREPYTSAPAVPKRRPLPAHWKAALQPDGSYEIGAGGPVQPTAREQPREMPLPAAEPVPAPPPPEPADQLPAVTIEPVILEATPEPRPARLRITSSDVAGSIARPTPAPDATPDRQPVTVEAVKEAGGSALVKTTPKPRKHVQAPQAEACPTPVRTARRPQPRAENGSAAPKPRRARRKSDFTPAEIRRFRRAVSRMKR